MTCPVLYLVTVKVRTCPLKPSLSPTCDILLILIHFVRFKSCPDSLPHSFPWWSWSCRLKSCPDSLPHSFPWWSWSCFDVVIYLSSLMLKKWGPYMRENEVLIWLSRIPWEGRPRLERLDLRATIENPTKLRNQRWGQGDLGSRPVSEVNLETHLIKSERTTYHKTRWLFCYGFFPHVYWKWCEIHLENSLE